MTSKTAQLNELIAITRDGERFYEHASKQVRSVHLQRLFNAMSRSKTEVMERCPSALRPTMRSRPLAERCSAHCVRFMPIPVPLSPRMKRRPMLRSWRQQSIASCTLLRTPSPMPIRRCKWYLIARCRKSVTVTLGCAASSKLSDPALVLVSYRRCH